MKAMLGDISTEDEMVNYINFTFLMILPSLQHRLHYSVIPKLLLCLTLVYRY